MESKNARKNQLEQWLSSTLGLPYQAIQAMPHAASMRRYFRIHTASGTVVAMDAKPPQENCQAYIYIANALRKRGLQTPEILASNLEQGFLLISDFGDVTYRQALNPQNADQLYRTALDALVVLQGCQQVPHHPIPPFTAEFMLQEWAWHQEWFLGQLLGLPPADQALNDCYQQIVAAASAQPQVFMHRDYHSENLMVLAQGVGLLDFQDAFIGPVTYDLVSLLRDCYVDWPEDKVTEWALAYWQLLAAQGVLTSVSAEQFLRWFDWMGVQRHLKALFTFARKHVRDQQSSYLQHMPRTLRYLQVVSGRYPEMTVLHHHLINTVQPAVQRVISSCVA